MKRFVLLALVLTLVLVMSGCFLFNRKPVVESIEISGAKTEEAKYKVELTLTLSDPDNDPLTVEIDWGDGSEKFSEENITTGTVDASHTYDSTGTYEVVITVSDGKAVVTLPTLKLNIPFQSESVILNF